MASPVRKSSSSNEGFFQAIPVLPNQLYDDVSLQRVLKLFLPRSVVNAVTPELATLGEKVLSKQILDWVTDAEHNVPYLRGGGRASFGQKTSELIVSQGWRGLQDFGIEQGIVASGYENQYAEYSRVVQYLRIYLWTGSCANVTCPSAMTDGAAKLLSNHLSDPSLNANSRKAFQDAYNHLTSRDPKHAWTSGQWMTERKGGSDVSGTETIATYLPSSSRNDLGPWSIDGFKWFSSATDSSMTVLLAQTPKGLSAFFAPMHRIPSKQAENLPSPEKELNGISIQRLKNKFGTKSLPTAELELKGTRGYLIGREGQGIQEISAILSITRLYSAASAIGYVGRGLAIAKAFANVREVGAGKGKRLKLKDSPLHMNTLAKITGNLHAMNLFTFFTAWLVGIEEHLATTAISRNGESTTNQKLRPDNLTDIPLLLRALTSILKASVCKRAIHSLQECMEALGGVGYLDNNENESINIARLYRDCCVLSIWEGTTDVLATDTLRVFKGRNGQEVLDALDRLIVKGLRVYEGRDNFGDKLSKEKAHLSHNWREIRGSIVAGDANDLISSARDLLFKVADVVVGVLLVVDAEQDMDPGIEQLCRRYLQEAGITEVSIETTSKKSLELNQRIVYGNTISRPFPDQAKL